MKITIEVGCKNDADDAAGLLLALSDAFLLIEDPEHFTRTKEAPVATVEPATAKRRGRPKKSEDPVAATIDADPVAADPVAATRADVPVAADPEPVTIAPEPEPTVAPEDARETLRNLARQKGVTWLRPILVAHNVARLVELTDQQVDEVLRDAA